MFPPKDAIGAPSNLKNVFFTDLDLRSAQVEASDHL